MKGKTAKDVRPNIDGDLKYAAENIVSCLEHWDSVDRIERIRKLREWLKTGEKR